MYNYIVQTSRKKNMYIYVNIHVYTCTVCSALPDIIVLVLKLEAFTRRVWSGVMKVVYRGSAAYTDRCGTAGQYLEEKNTILYMSVYELMNNTHRVIPKPIERYEGIGERTTTAGVSSCWKEKKRGDPNETKETITDKIRQKIRNTLLLLNLKYIFIALVSCT